MRKYVRTIQDCPEAEALVKRLNSYETQLFQTGQQAGLGFAVGRSGNTLHFSRRTNFLGGRFHEPALAWAGWEPTITKVRALVHALTCPPEELPPIALKPQDCNDYDFVHLKFVGHAKVPSTQAIARNIAIARLEGKL